MLYSYNVIIMKVLLKSDENKYDNKISYNSQVFAYRMICNSLTVDLIILCNSVEFVQKFQIHNFQICAIDISNNSQTYVYGMICDSCIMCYIILCSSVEFVQKLRTTISDL